MIILCSITSKWRPPVNKDFIFLVPRAVFVSRFHCIMLCRVLWNRGWWLCHRLIIHSMSWPGLVVEYETFQSLSQPFTISLSKGSELLALFVIKELMWKGAVAQWENCCMLICKFVLRFIRTINYHYSEIFVFLDGVFRLALFVTGSFIWVDQCQNMLVSY